jgi:hypothetical protein
MQLIERTEGHYDVREVEFGTVYRWCPECVVIECDCGERAALTGSDTVCECGAEHAGVLREESDTAEKLEDEELHPWRYAGERDYGGMPC